MRDWALPLLACPVCGAGPLDRGADGLTCPGCGAGYPTRDGVTDLLAEPAPEVARERAAVAGLDRGAPAGPDPRADPLARLYAGEGLTAEELADPYLRHAAETRERTLELLRHHPPPAGAVLLELGADHCWGSGPLLDRGLRVIALDITDHLHHAARGADPSLCRIQADMNRLPLAHAAVDAVWATAAAHHSWDLARTLREAARVLRPGGRLYLVCEPMPSWLRHPFGRGVGRRERELGINETWVPRRTWLRLCRRAGLRPRLVFPELGRSGVEERLRRRGLPASLAPLARPLQRLLQVSIHLLATRE